MDAPAVERLFTFVLAIVTPCVPFSKSGFQHSTNKPHHYRITLERFSMLIWSTSLEREWNSNRRCKDNSDRERHHGVHRVLNQRAMERMRE
jgi:hypothetical protein